MCGVGVSSIIPISSISNIITSTQNEVGFFNTWDISMYTISFIFVFIVVAVDIVNIIYNKFLIKRRNI
jgi:hypothetical protein